MSNSVATTSQTRAVAIPEQGVDTPLRTDIVVPYVIAMQATSDLVKSRKAQMGDIVRSTTGEKLAEPDSGLNVIFLHNPRAEWVIEQKQGERYKYKKTIPRNAANENLPWTYWADEDGNEVPENTKGATQWRRVKRLAVFALLPQDIKAEADEIAKAEAGELPDPSKALTPVILSFRSTSYKAGRDICTFFTKASSLGAKMWKYQVPMTVKLEQSDGDSWYVWQANTTKTPPVPKEMLPKVESWVNILGHANLSIHEEGETEVQPTERTVVETKDVC